MPLNLSDVGRDLLRQAMESEFIQENPELKNSELLNRLVSQYLPENNQNINQNQEISNPPEHIQAYSNGGSNMYDIEQTDNLNDSIVYQDDNGRWKSNNPYANAIMQIESRGNAKAHNKSGASGLYQFVPTTAEAFGLKDPYNAEESHKAFIKLVNDNSRILAKMGVPVNDDTRWWAHNIGPQQAKEVYNYINFGTPVSQRTLKYIKANGGFTNPKDYALHWHKRISELKGV